MKYECKENILYIIIILAISFFLIISLFTIRSYEKSVNKCEIMNEHLIKIIINNSHSSFCFEKDLIKNYFNKNGDLAKNDCKPKKIILQGTTGS